MAIFRARAGSREGIDHYPVRSSFSLDQNNDLKEPLLLESLAESGDSSSSSTRGSISGVKNRSPVNHRLSTNMLPDMTLPIFPCNNNNNANNSGNSNCSSSNNTNSLAWYTPLLTSIRHNPDSLYIGIALVAWYWVGVLAICTTKLLLSTPQEEGGVPAPLLFTFQQMCLGSTFLRTFLWIKGRITGTGIQPWPVEREAEDSLVKASSWLKPVMMVDFLLLSGLFNGLDFLASNTSFSHSSASFVETIKASEPITTTGLAVWWGIDRLGKMEALALTVLITGVLISTYANATASDMATESPSLQDSFKTSLTIMTANLCFAFRTLAQKMLRSSASGSAGNLDDINLLYRMQQTGAASLLVPVLLFEHHKLYQVLFERESWNVMGYYVGLSLINAWAFATYTLASCFILTRISVVQHSGFGCLRRLFAIVATSIAFGVPIHALGGMGILMSVVGFAGFSHFRFQRQGQGKKEESRDDSHHEDDSNCYSLLKGTSDSGSTSSSDGSPCCKV